METGIQYDPATNCWYHPDDGPPPAKPMTKCPKCGQMTVRYRQQAYGDEWTCTWHECNYTHYYSLGD